MTTQPIAHAVVTTHTDGHTDLPYSPLFGDVYHPAAGALEQARAVFLAGNHLPQRWAQRDSFVILETGFGLGNNFLATWDAWRQDERRCERLVFISIEKHPLRRGDLAHRLSACGLPELAAQLVAAWPALTPNIHTLSFDGGQVQLHLALGDVADMLPSITAQVDAFYLDGFAPDRNPQMWDRQVIKRFERLAAPGASVATWSATRALRDNLEAAGFVPERLPGFAGKREMTRARFVPKYTATHKPAGGLLIPQLRGKQRRALIIGGGLAGSAAAWGLAEQGWHSTVLDTALTPAQGSSGNPGGIFHGIINAQDSRHARAHRAGALSTASLVRRWIAEGRIAGQCKGLLRLEPKPNAEPHTMIERSGLPLEYITWLEPDAARLAAGIPVPCGGWWYAEGGWLDPRNYVQTLLESAGAQFIGGVTVANVRKQGELWQALGPDGEVLAQAPILVIAAANGSAALVEQVMRSVAPQWDHYPDARPQTWLPLSSVRGQITQLPASLPALLHPQVPVAGAGYLLPPHLDHVVCGATSQPDDPYPQVRGTDNLYNLHQITHLGALGPAGPRPATLDMAQQAAMGRVGWRAVTPDRLPLIGALPDPQIWQSPDLRRRLDQPRLIPRLRDSQGGVFVVTGLGTRGITWAALAGRLLASWVSGSPCPVENDLRDALDAARFLARSVRRKDDTLSDRPYKNT